MSRLEQEGLPTPEKRKHLLGINPAERDTIAGKLIDLIQAEQRRELRNVPVNDRRRRQRIEGREDDNERFEDTSSLGDPRPAEVE
jgi:hypothetical protein